MKSRYDFMQPGNVRDESSFDYYPDPLTLNFHTFTLKEPLEALQLTDSDITKFWWAIHKRYGTAEYDDVILGLNNIAHKNFMKEGDIIYIPSVADIEQSFAKVNQ